MQPIHWTRAQRWTNEHDETLIAADLLELFGTYLRMHHISLIDYPCDRSIRMDDGSIWHRLPPA